jgi:cysteine desulfurase/selenocysteine lyase
MAEKSSIAESVGVPAGFDPHRVRGDFPILSRTVADGRPLAYLDNAATTQKPRAVLDALQEYYSSYNSNVHRAIHELGQEATEAYEDARGVCAGFINAPESACVVFTRGTTESINLVAYAWGRASICEGDQIIATEMEHHSNLVPWQILAKEKGANLLTVPVLEDGTLDLDVYESLLSPRVKLVAVTHMSNILGTINPLPRMISAAHAAGAKFLVDAAQSVPHFEIDVQNLDCDFLACSGHKMLGPTGIGILYARRELLEEMPPFMGGGEMIHKVTLEQSTWAEIPHKFEAGTPNIAGAIGLRAAVRYLQSIGMGAIRDHEESLTAYALQRLRSMPDIRILGDAPDRGGVLSFLMDDIHPHDIAQLVDREGVAIRAGHGCAQPLLRRFGTNAVSRASFCLYSTEEDIEQLCAALGKARDFFHHGNG